MTELMELLHLRVQTDSSCNGCHSAMPQRTTDTQSTLLSLIEFFPIYPPMHNAFTHDVGPSFKDISKDDPHLKTVWHVKNDLGVFQLLQAANYI